MKSSFFVTPLAVLIATVVILISLPDNSEAQLHTSKFTNVSSSSLFPDYANTSVDSLSDNDSPGSNRSFLGSPQASSLNDVDNFEVASLKQSSAKYFNNGLRHQPHHGPPPEPLYVAPLPPPPPPLLYPSHVKYPSVYTRVKLGYGNFYYNGNEAELRCQFPHDLHTVSNYVWSKVTDNLVHYLDSYRIFERSYGHTSSLFIRDVMDKDFGVYSCAVSGSSYGTQTVTFYQEVHFYPPQPHTYLNPAYGK